MGKYLYNKYFLSITGIFLFFALWETITYLKVVKPVFLPSPIETLYGLFDLVKRGWLQNAVYHSIYRVFIALVFVSLIGIGVGSLMGASKLANGLLTGVISGLKSIPATGFLGLIVLWFSIEERAKIIFLFLGSIFYMILLVRDSFRNTHNSDYEDVAKNLGATGFQLFRKVSFPAALPQIYNAVIISNSLMWTYIVLAEYINGNEEQSGIGYLIYISSRTQDSPKVFGLLMLIALLASAFDYILKMIKKKFIRWN